jgi:hypothetical protein
MLVKKNMLIYAEEYKKIDCARNYGDSTLVQWQIAQKCFGRYYGSVFRGRAENEIGKPQI